MKLPNAFGMGTAIAVGVAIGSLLDNVTMGIGIGLALGIASAPVFRKPDGR